MRLWLPEKASARLSIKGFVGAGCIFPRHRALMSHKRAESYQGDLYIRSSRCFTRRNGVRRDIRKWRENDAWLSVAIVSVRHVFTRLTNLLDLVSEHIREILLSDDINYDILTAFLERDYYSFSLSLSLFFSR